MHGQKNIKLQNGSGVIFSITFFHLLRKSRNKLHKIWWILSSFNCLISFLGTVVKLRKATISFSRLSACPPAYLSVHLSVRMEHFGSQWTDFHEIWYLCRFFLNLLRETKFRENLTRITDTLHEDQYTFWSYLAHFFLEWEIFQIKVVKKIETYILFSITIFFEKRALCETMWKNIVERVRP